MGSALLWVLVVVIPASAASVLVLLVDVRAHRRRPRRPPVPSRLTAALGAALGAGGFGLASFAGFAPAAHAAHGPELVWVATATPGCTAAAPVLSSGCTVAVAPLDPLAIAGLPYAPVVIWGTGFDGEGTWEILAQVPGAADASLASGSWPSTSSGEGVRLLAPGIDPAALVAAAKAAGVVPQNGVYTLVLRTSDPTAQVVFTLAAPPAQVPQPPAAAAAGVPPITGAVASSVQRRTTAATPAPGGAPSVGVPATGGGAPLVAGLAMLLAGGASAGLSLRLRRAGG